MGHCNCDSNGCCRWLRWFNAGRVLKVSHPLNFGGYKLWHPGELRQVLQGHVGVAKSIFSYLRWLVKKVKLATKVEGDPKASFLIATIARGGRYSFPGLLHFTLIMLSVKQGSIKYHFWVFGMTRPGIEPRSPGPLTNTLTIMPVSGDL